MLAVALDPIQANFIAVLTLVFGAWCIVANWGIALAWWLRKQRASSVPLLGSASFLIGACFLVRGWSWWFLLVLVIDFVTLLTLGWLIGLLAAWAWRAVLLCYWGGNRG